MKKILFLCLVASIAPSLIAQTTDNEKYHAYRLQPTEPPYGLRKVKALIHRIKMDKDDMQHISTKNYNSLSFEEKFTYNMLQGEVFSQNCSEMPIVEDEAKKIFAHPPGAFGDEAEWSERQTSYLKNNRKKVIGLIRATMKTHRHVGVNFKKAVLEMNAVELVPDLVGAFNRERKDLDIVTVLMLLMKENKYGPFTSSAVYAKLYGDENNWYTFIDANGMNTKTIVGQAVAFYGTKFK